MPSMLRYVHRLSAFLFYALGSSFFLAYILWRNEVGGELPLQWLTGGDLVMLCAALLYGGLSVYLSIDRDGTSKALRWILFGLMAACFAVFAALNFWNRFSL